MFAEWPASIPMPKIPINKTPMPKTAPAWRPDAEREICALADMPLNAARGFTLFGDNENDKLELIVWRRGAAAEGTDALAGFINQCPHMGLPLETFPDRFLSADGTALICSAHGARFRFDGACFTGPCKGQNLQAVTLKLRDGHIFLAAGPP